jgi:hypothetical protein
MFIIRFTEDQLNFVLNVVAERPFKDIHTLVGSIQQQAQQQMAGGTPESFAMNFDEDQLNYVINVVADRPFKDVHQIITTIQQQATAQLDQQQAAQGSVEGSGEVSAQNADVVPDSVKTTRKRK